MKILAILTTKVVAFLLALIHRGGSLPGQIGLKLCPNILKKLKKQGPIILVTGTNGKTSTANMISETFENAGYHVISNRKGDNLRAGITTTLLKNTSLNGRISAQAIILEVDELNIPYIIKNLSVDALVVTNFFRDQLDRAREMEQLIQKIETSLDSFEGTFVLNGNDPNVVRLKDQALRASVVYYGMKRCDTSVEQTVEAAEGKFCPRCQNRLEYAYYQYSHIGEFHCTSCDFKTPKLQASGQVMSIPKRTFTFSNHEFHAPQGGLYTMYNCMAVLCVAQLYQLDYKHAEKAFTTIKVPDGRNEELQINEKTCILNLVKNPTGANEVMKVIEEDTSDKTILIVLNDNDQDGTDISWIYDTFFEKLIKEETKEILVSGTRCYDIALRLKYGGYTKPIHIYEDLQSGVDAFLMATTSLYAIATYTALQPVRNLLLAKNQ